MMQLPNKTQLESPNFWLLILTGLLISLNWYLVKYDSVYLIFWIAALSITWRNRNHRSFNSDFFSSSIGLFLLFWILFRCFISNNNADVLSDTYPLVSLFAICLLATKITKINQYWREIIIISLTGIPFDHIFAWWSPTENITFIDAKLSRIILWYLGFDVHQVGNFVFLPKGSIEILDACSSFSLLWLMWQFCLIIYLCLDLKKPQKILLFIWANIIALFTNSLRLCLMAILVANEQTEAFGYWHGGSGAEIFTTIAILLFALTYWLLTRQKNQDLSKLYES